MFVISIKAKEKIMICKGELRFYDVTWRSYGWTGAIPVVKVRKCFLFINYWSKVWEGKTEDCCFIEKAYPEQIKKLNKKAVEEYENYINAWSQETENHTVNIF